MRQAYPEVRLRVRERMAVVSRGDTVLATCRDGTIDGEPEYGLYVHQTRLLSRYRVRLGGVPPLLAASSNSRQDRWEGYFIVAPPGDGQTRWRTDPQVASQENLELRIGRIVGEGMHEDLDITNYARRPVSVSLVLELDSDFADPEETKGERRQQGRIERTWARDGDDAWVLRHAYRASRRVNRKDERGTLSIDRILRMRVAHASSPPVRRAGRIAFEVVLAPHQQWHACIEWHAEIDGHRLPIPQCPLRSGYAETERTEAPYLDEATRFETAESRSSATAVMETLEQARHDINALRLHRMDLGEREWTVAAGVPMYVGFFGRDTLLAAWQAAMAGPELLRGTLPHLARLQGRRIDDWRDEQPGRILHEAHNGPIAALQLHPKGRYYGSMSSSGLFPFCVAQLWNWTADRSAVAPLIGPAMDALAWLDRHGREHRDGFYAYRTRSRQGLENQAWKDSSDAIVEEDGSQVGQPAATCEEQGTVFAAKVAFAEVLWAFGHKRDARRLHREAMELRKRFNDAYWVSELGFFAMALAPDGHQVRSIGSNALHTLSTGIAGDAFVPKVIERLFARDMFSGWGIRTLSADHPAYNPYAYHRGTVWPVEHGPFAIGAFRGGYHHRVQQVARAMFEAALIFDSHRLPECFSGHPRDAAHPFPSLYPPANVLQAWSATTPFSLVQAMLGLQPFAPAGVLLVDPHLPAWLPTLCLRRLRVGDSVLDLEFRLQPDGSTSFEVVRQSGPLRIERRATSWELATSFGDGLKQLLAA